uniref:Uncharacterized protein n=1 Tax=Octopus bimaculoides TaxID=37653 RepID=A0A0L8FIZ5_OCTBM
MTYFNNEIESRRYLVTHFGKLNFQAGGISEAR